MKLKIVSKGTAASTRVIDAATGKPIENVEFVAWHCKPDGVPSAIIAIANAAVDITTEAEQGDLDEHEPESASVEGVADLQQGGAAGTERNAS